MKYSKDSFIRGLAPKGDLKKNLSKSHVFNGSSKLK